VRSPQPGQPARQSPGGQRSARRAAARAAAEHDKRSADGADPWDAKGGMRHQGQLAVHSRGYAVELARLDAVRALGRSTRPM
jgi:hypothetical protein